MLLPDLLQQILITLSSSRRQQAHAADAWPEPAFEPTTGADELIPRASRVRCVSQDARGVGLQFANADGHSFWGLAPHPLPALPHVTTLGRPVQRVKVAPKV